MPMEGRLYSRRRRQRWEDLFSMIIMIMIIAAKVMVWSMGLFVCRRSYAVACVIRLERSGGGGQQ